MKYVHEFRDPKLVAGLVDEIRNIPGPERALMEVCGGQTHAIVRYGIDKLVSGKARLIHGPGCPVCVTPLEMIDRALAVSRLPEVTLCSFGDMLRVPGSHGDLLSARAAGADVRIVYSPLDAVKLAVELPDRQVVFFAVGFETTAPATAMAVAHAEALGLDNFSMLVSHVLVPPAIAAIMSEPKNRIDGFLAAGHVCAVMGTREYEPLCREHRVPIVVTGFEPVDILRGILRCLNLCRDNRPELDNTYARAVPPDGNPAAIAQIRKIFTVSDRKWRGIGNIPDSGLELSPQYLHFDASHRFDIVNVTVAEPESCRSGEVLQGRLRPDHCEEFGTGCTPEHPLGATMVSTEGACAAYYRYRRTDGTTTGDSDD